MATQVQSDFATRSFWQGQPGYVPGPPLEGDEQVDVVIVGGGFTGLWSAIHLKEAEPSLKVAVVEREVIGYGASGRNGGFAMTMVGRNLAQLERNVGPELARALHLAMVESLQELETFARHEGIDADVTHPGLLTVSNGTEQDARIERDVEVAYRLGLKDFRFLGRDACRALLYSEQVRCGHFEQHALLLDPARLAYGLKRAAEKRGVKVYEGTGVELAETRTKRGQVVVARAPRGTLTADKGLIATNAYAQGHPELGKYLFVVYAYILVTEPLSHEQWARVGWQQGMGVEDKRVMPHFHRPTPDGRILWGGRDAPVVSGGPSRSHDRDTRCFERLEETFRWTFPQLSDVRIAQGWGGPVCGTLTCIPTVGSSAGGRLFHALGYSGHGVGPSFLVGKLVRDLMLERKSELLDLPMVSMPPTRFPPEPLKSWGLRLSQRALQRADDTHGERGGPIAKLGLDVLEGERKLRLLEAPLKRLAPRPH